MSDPQSEFSESGGLLNNAVQQVDGLLESSQRSGNFNSLTDGSPLYYPLDIFANENPTENSSAESIVNWMEFRIFFKQNGNLSSTVKTIESFGQSAVETGSSLLGLNQTDEASGELRTILADQSASGVPGSGQQQSVTRDTRFAKATENTGDSVFLYLPGGIQFDDGINYEETSFAGLQAVKSGASAVGGVVALNALRKLAGGVDKAAGIVGQESLNTGAALSAGLGVVVNPRKEQMFQGINMRTFNFSFVFSPRSREEAEMVAKIIKVFRFHAYPEVSSNSAFFNFPSEFEIKFRTLNTDLSPGVSVTDNPVLPKLNRCVLEKISTNFTPDEVFYSFKNGMPPKITLELSFKEAEFITRQHVNEGF